MEKRTYSVEEAARFLGIGRTAAYEAVRTGQIPSLRIGKRILIPIIAFENLLRDSKGNTVSDKEAT